MLNTKSVNVIDVSDWDALVQETYGIPYSFQQQDGCKDRGKEYISVPIKHPDYYKNDTIPEIVNGEEMGVSFKAWLERDPNAPLNPTDEELEKCPYFHKEDRIKWCASKSHINMFYERNFYPHVDMIVNDLHTKGLLPAGDYIIDIDW